MIKRPLGFGCLGAAVLLFLLAWANPAPYYDYGEYQGEWLMVTGRVYKKETVARTDGPVTVLYLKHNRTDTGIGEEALAGSDLEENTAAEPAIANLATANLATAKPATANLAVPSWERVMCYLKAGQKEPEIGSTVRLLGKLAAFERASNPGQFDTYSYYQISKISYRLNQAIISAKTKNYSRLGETCYQIKIYLSGKLEESLPKEEFSVMQAMLLGVKGNMEKELKELYQRNGIAHVLAISGLHVSLLGMGLYKLLKGCGMPVKAAAVFSALFMLLFGVMAGFSVSALRAIIMFALQMAAILFERTYDMLTAAAVAAVLILLGQPLYLHHSGFLFSFGCVIGIGLLLPVLVEGKCKENQAISAVVGSLGMMVITLPVYLWFYYQFPVYSVFLNLLVIPLMSFLLGAGILLLLSRIMCPALSAPFALFIQGALKIYKGMCGFCESLPGNLLTPGKPETWQVAVYLLLMVLLVLFGKRIKLLGRWCIAAFAMALLIYHPERGLEVTFLDVGQGDCIYIENDEGSCYLVDGGSSSVSGVGKYRILPFLKARGASRLRAVFVTHPDEDHCNGIGELLEIGREEGILINNLVLPDVEEDLKNEAYRRLEAQAGEAGIPLSYINKGEKIMDGKLSLVCLNPSLEEHYEGTNEYSVVLKLSYGAFSVMLTGDVEGNGERGMILSAREMDLGKVTVLKAAHHGSKGSTPDEFLDIQMPVYTVISCGRNNSYGHPHKELTDRLSAHGTHILITYETGAVTFTTDGKRVKLAKFFNE